MICSVIRQSTVKNVIVFIIVFLFSQDFLANTELPVCYRKLTDHFFQVLKASSSHHPPKIVAAMLGDSGFDCKMCRQAKLKLMYITSEDASPISSNY